MKDDLISRQTLIDAFKEEFYTMYSDDYNYMIKFFNDLPTADLSEYCDKLWKTAYERGKAETRIIIKLTEEDKESLKKAMNEAELTLMPAEIIHCKDCRWWGVSNTCGHWDGMVTAPANGFCSYGERKSDG